MGKSNGMTEDDERRIPVFQPKPITTVEAAIKAIIDEEKYGEYLGGSLCFDLEGKLVMLCVDGRGSIADVPYRQTPAERLLVCQAYLKYKTPSHTLYIQAQEYVQRRAE